MNVTTRKSDCDPKQRIRQLEVAIEHALAAATASRSNNVNKTLGSWGTVEVSYPGFEFRETLKTLRPNAGVGGRWIVLDLGDAPTLEECNAACTVLQHYYPDEIFAVGTIRAALAS